MRPRTIKIWRDTRTEKVVVAAGDALMIAMGFRIISFSQSRATMQTPGISDRLFINPDRRLGCFWEAKRAGRVGGGKYGQTPFQKEFQRLVESLGWDYVLGTEENLIDWAVAHGLATRTAVGIQLTRMV